MAAWWAIHVRVTAGVRSRRPDALPMRLSWMYEGREAGVRGGGRQPGAGVSSSTRRSTVRVRSRGSMEEEEEEKVEEEEGIGEWRG